MKNFTTFYSKIDAIIEARSSKKERSKGLLAPEKSTSKKEATSKNDMTEKIADYIEAIRNQKRSMLNGD
jgi:23S rRNA maturation-related 3'-5' exoribonuclease YhaM